MTSRVFLIGFFLPALLGLAPGPGRAQLDEPPQLIDSAEALSRAVRSTLGVAVLCACPLDNSTETSGYYLSQSLTHFWSEARRFVHFAKNPPTDPETLGRLFERMQLLVAKVDGIFLELNPCFFELPCTVDASWARTKERMADLAEAFGTSLVPPDDPIVFESFP